MEMMTLAEIASAVGARIDGAHAETPITEVCTDTRKLTPGCLFIPLVGENFDGHDFLQAACAQAAAVLSHRETEGLEKPVLRVRDTGQALLDLAHAYRLRFTLPIVGVTGSVGKTTTKEMIYTVLSSQFKTLRTAGNLNNQVGLPLTLLGLRGEDEAAVIEMGMSGLGEISALSKATEPTVAVVTNIGVSHIENLGSRENILKAKLEIADGLRPGAPLLLNLDNDLLKGVRQVGEHPIKTYAVQNPSADVRARSIREQGFATSFEIVYQGESYPAVIPCIGEHNVLNAAAAFYVGVLAGVAPAQCARALRDYEPAGMRQRIRQTDGVTVIEDCYNASPDSMRASLRTLVSIKTEGRRIAVLGDMLELGKVSGQSHYAVGELAGSLGVDLVVCVGSEAALYAKGAEKTKGVQTARFAQNTQAADWLRSAIRPGDVVLFKASRGMRLEEIIHTLWK